MLSTDECLRGCPPKSSAGSPSASDDRPEIFPINYVVDRGAVVFRTAAGTKLAGSVLGSHVAFEADGVDPVSGDAWSVIVKGEATELERIDDLFDALALPLYPWHAAPKHHFVRIHPSQVTGRRLAIVGPDAWSETARTAR